MTNWLKKKYFIINLFPMFKKFISFLKYNNLTVFIVLVVFLLTSGVFAQTEAGQEFIGAEDIGSADNLTDVYEDYIASKDPDHDDVFGIIDNCPNDYNPAQLDGDDDGIGDVCDHEPESQKSNVESEEGTGTSTLDFLEGSTPEVNDEDPDQTLNSNDDGNTPPANADPSQEGNVEGGDADTSQVGSVDDGTSSEDSGFGAEETVITEEPDVVIFEIENQ